MQVTPEFFQVVVAALYLASLKAKHITSYPITHVSIAVLVGCAVGYVGHAIPTTMLAALSILLSWMAAFRLVKNVMTIFQSAAILPEENPEVRTEGWWKNPIIMQFVKYGVEYIIYAVLGIPVQGSFFGFNFGGMGGSQPASTASSTGPRAGSTTTSTSTNPPRDSNSTSSSTDPPSTSEAS